MLQINEHSAGFRLAQAKHRLPFLTAERMANRVSDQPVDRIRLGETNFFFRWMNVYVDPIRINVHKENESRIMAFRKKRSVPLCNGVKHGGIPNRPPVHEQILRLFRHPRMNRIDYVAIDREPRNPASHLDGMIEEGRAVHLQDAVTI